MDEQERDVPEKWVPLVRDDEAGAVAKIVDALDGLDQRQQKRIIEWAKDRYDNTIENAALMLMERAVGMLTAVREAIKRCPVCGGKGTMPADEHGFRAQCGYCTPLRQAEEKVRG